MSEPKLLVPLKPKEERSSKVSKGAQLILGYNSNRKAAIESRGIQHPELDAAVGNTSGSAPAKTDDFVAPSTLTDDDYNTQKTELNKQLEALNQQYRTVWIDQGGDYSALTSQISDVESKLRDLESRYATKKYEDAYGRMSEESRTALSGLGSIINDQQNLIVRYGKNNDRVKELEGKIDAVRNDLSKQGFTDAEIDSLIKRSQQDYNAEQTKALRESAYNKADGRSGAGNLGVRILNDTAAGAGAVDLFVQNLFAGKDAITGQKEVADYNTVAQQFVHRSDAVTKAHNENIAESMAKKHGAETEEAAKATNRRAFMNDILASMGTSGATIALSPILGPTAAAMIQGSSAAAKTMHEYHNNGYTDGQALTMGLLAGAIETATEKIGIDSLFSLKNVGGLTGKELMKQLALNIGKQGATEGMEEGLSTILNTLAESIVLADESTIRRDVDALVAQGMSRKEAEKQVMLNWVKEFGASVLGGAISGGLFGVGGSLINLSSKTDAKVQQQADEQISERSSEEIKEPAEAESPLIVQQEQATAEEAPEPVSPLMVQQEQTTPEQKEQNNPLADAVMGEGKPVEQTPAPADGTFAEMQEQADEFHPINEEGAASAKATHGRDPVQVPKKNFDGHLTSKTASTIINSGLTPNGVAQSLADLLGSGKFSRIPYSDADAVAKAKKTVADKGFDKAVEYYHTEVVNGKRGKTLSALGIELFNQAAQEGKIMVAADIAADIIESAREQAQAIQVLNLFNKATPEGRVYLAIKGVDNLISKMEKKYGDRASGIKVSQDLMNDYCEKVKAGDKQGAKEAWQEIQKDIAAQIPPNWKDRLQAWRYLAMLGNFKTHIRNLAGNTAFMPVRMMKNVVGAVAESISGTENRTKAILNPLNAQDRQLMQMAWQDYGDAMEGSSTSRYDEATSDIERERKVLAKPLDKLAKGNAKLLAKEDQWFSQPAYAGALAGWFKANNVSPDMAAKMLAGENPEMFAKAREYAIKEAKKSTYQDSNALSDAVAKLGSSSKGARFVVDAVLPFKRTPANVLMRGIEYSPVYFAKGVGEMMFGVRSGKVTASEAIDHFASGFVGSAILGAGFLLAKSGILRASGDDDDKQAAFDALQGKQDYSLTFGNDSFTIDWASPVVLPLFVGAEVYNLLSNEGNADDATTSDYINALIGIADPILETSMLSGVNDLINSVGYSDAGFASIAKNIAMNYIGSFLPTILGQAERSFDTSRGETYRYNESEHLDAGGQREWGGLLNKVPGRDYGQIDYVDAWGRTQDYSDNLLLRALNQGFNPSYISEERTTEVDAELQRLYDLDIQETANVFPTRRGQSEEITLHDSKGNATETRHLTAEEYERFNRTQGQTALKMVSELMDSADYKAMSDASKAAAIGKVYDYAKAMATLEIDKNAPVDQWITKAQKADNTAAYLRVYSAYTYGSNDTHRDYETLDGIMNSYSSLSKKDKEAISYGSNLDELYAASKAGIDSKTWYRTKDAVSELKPIGDNKGVRAWQELETVLSTASSRDVDFLLKQYMTGNYPQMYDLARQKGFSAEKFVEFYKAMNTIEGDKYTDGKNKGKTIPGTYKKKLQAWAKENGWSTHWFNYMYKLTGSDSWELKAWDNSKW